MTATPVDKTYIMLMVGDMSRALRFYTEAFAVTVVINSPYWSEPPRSAGGSPLQHARDPRSASELPNLPTPKAT